VLQWLVIINLLIKIQRVVGARSRVCMFYVVLRQDAILHMLFVNPGIKMSIGGNSAMDWHPIQERKVLILHVATHCRILPELNAGRGPACCSCTS